MVLALLAIEASSCIQQVCKVYTSGGCGAILGEWEAMCSETEVLLMM